LGCQARRRGRLRLCGEVGVAAVVGHQAGVIAGLDDVPVIQHRDLVGVAHGGEPVRDGDGEAAAAFSVAVTVREPRVWPGLAKSRFVGGDAKVFSILSGGARVRTRGLWKEDIVEVTSM
jgi:hypothetical protein